MSHRETLAGSPDVRRTNLAILLRHLHLDGPMRRAELTDRLGLTRSTVGALVAELTRLGAVDQTATVPTSAPLGRGRPSPFIRPRPLGVQVLAAEVWVDHVEVALVGLGGTVLHRDSHPLPDPAPETQHAVFVESEVGVGSGVIVDGKPLRGAGGYAGELGHIAVVGVGGRRCRCGSTGCWETEIGQDAIARALGLSAEVQRRTLVAALRVAGPGEVRQLDQVAHHLGAGLATVVNIFNPSLIVLGGLLRELYPQVASEVQRTVLAGALATPAKQVKVALPELCDDAVLLGAAEAVWQRVLLDPGAALSA